MANNRIFNNLNLPLLIQSRRRNCYVDRITAVFDFQRLVCFFSLSSVRIRNFFCLDLTFLLAVVAPQFTSIQQPHNAREGQTHTDTHQQTYKYTYT